LVLQRVYIEDTLREYFRDKPVLKAYLFGSYARGEEKDNSDIDVLIEYDPESRFNAFDLGGMYEDLKEIFHKDVDVLTTDGISKFIKPFIEKDKQLFYVR
jgi:predicted nucleotidyltransferase